MSRHVSCDTLSSNLISRRLLNHFPDDMPALSKVCGLDSVNIASNYWRIPDTNMHLTAIAGTQSDVPLLAIASASTESNLFLYELDTCHRYLTHHTTVLLPNIHALTWAPGNTHLVTGNSRGYAHAVAVPLPEKYGESVECAEIVTRFNHRKHLRKHFGEKTGDSMPVANLAFAGDQLVSVYGDAVFQWDMKSKPRPVSIGIVPGVSSFDACDMSTLALAGAHGISLYDTRSQRHSVPSTKMAGANLVKWHADGIVLASAHTDGVVRLWDIRREGPFAELTGQQGKTITAVEWNHDDVFTGASDGSIVHWDMGDMTSNKGSSSSNDSISSISSSSNSSIFSTSNETTMCSLRDGLGSVDFDTIHNSLVDSLSERQCGTRLPALNNCIVGMCTVSGSDDSDCQIVTIDGSAFLGLHLKIYNDDEEKNFYLEDDMALMRQETSNATLVSPTESMPMKDTEYGIMNVKEQRLDNESKVEYNHHRDELDQSLVSFSDDIRPLTIRRKHTLSLSPIPSMGSSDTVCDVEDLNIHQVPDSELCFGSRLPGPLVWLNMLPNLSPIESLLSKTSPCSTIDTDMFSFLDVELDKIRDDFQNELRLEA